MIVTANQLLLAAAPQVNHIRAISEHWGDTSDLPIISLLAILAALILALGLLRLRRYFKQRRFAAKPTQVFLNIARAANVSFADQWLLVRIARHQHLPPLTLLLSPRTLRHHAQQYVQKRHPTRRRAVMRRIAAIRRELFGSMRHEKLLEARYNPPSATPQAPAPQP